MDIQQVRKKRKTVTGSTLAAMQKGDSKTKMKEKLEKTLKLLVKSEKSSDCKTTRSAIEVPRGTHPGLKPRDRKPRVSEGRS
ncbi:hypothetical protein GX48_01297 [Paracoccidioides brasiliensis]|nr:hypothetical protein GX48_01297 [Paracoccidioides brasiliensis]